MKSVLFITQRPPYPPNKGEKLRSYHQIRYLVEKGYVVLVACLVQSEQDQRDLADLEKKLGVQHITQRGRPSSLQKLLALPRKISISESVFFSAKLHAKINRAIEENKIDAVVATASSLVGYLTRLSVPCYMDFMDMDSDKWNQYAQYGRPVMRWLYRREARKVAELEALAGKICKACYFISDKECDLYRASINANAENILKVANGIDTQEFYPPARVRRSKIDGDVRLVFVGVMDYKPNVDAVSWFCKQVWPKLLVEQPDASFKIVGMNPTAEVRSLASYKGVDVTGKVDTVIPFFHEADVFVAPFRLARGVQNKVLQAFACGLPLVSTPMGLEGIDIGQGEVATQAETPEQFLSTILHLVKDANIRVQMSESGVKLIREQYSWHAMLGNFLREEISTK